MQEQSNRLTSLTLHLEVLYTVYMIGRLTLIEYFMTGIVWGICICWEFAFCYTSSPTLESELPNKRTNQTEKVPKNSHLLCFLMQEQFYEPTITQSAYF